jgi:hypothetical protein
VSSPLYLGTCAFEPRPFTRVDPYAIAECGFWRVDHEWQAALPTEGRAFAPHMGAFHMGELFVFRVEPNRRPDPERDLFLVCDSAPIEEVIDFRSVDQEIARRTVVELGITSLMPGTTRIVAALADSTCVVVRMKRHPADDRYVAELDSLDELSTYALDASVFDGDRIRGHVVAVPGITVGQKLGTINWCRDADFLESVLKRLRRMSPAGKPSIARAQVPSLVAYLSQVGLMPWGGKDLVPMRRRLASFSSELAQNFQALDELVDVVCALGPVKAQLEEELAVRRADLEAELRTELEQQVRTELEQQMTSLTEARSHLTTEVAELGRQCTRVRHDADAAREALDELRAALRDELVTVRTALDGVPAGAAESVREISERLAERLRKHDHNFDLIPGVYPPWGRIHFRLPWEPRSWNDAPEALAGAAKRFGYAADELTLADVAVRAGLLVVVPENEAGSFARCQASAMANGEVVRQILDPAIICLDDLWRQPSTSIPTAFAHAWVAAQLDPRRYRVVLLDGLQRTPMDLWLPALTDVIAAPSRPRNLLLFASIGAGSVDPARVWKEIDQVVISIFPERATGLTPELFADASGKPTLASCFDAEAAPHPSRPEILEFLDDCSADQPASSLRVVINALRAAWPLRAQISPAEMARSFSGYTDAKASKPHRELLLKGVDWLRTVLKSAEN